MKSRVLLIGGFHKSLSLADSLIKKGYSVTVINNDYQKCLIMAEINALSVIYGDGTRPFVLEDANAQEADIAIALTQDDADNLVICELCKKKFHIKKTVALVNDPKKNELFYKMGVDSVVSAVNVITNVIEQQAFLDGITTLLLSGKTRISIAEVPILDNAPIVGKKLWEMNLPAQVIIGWIIRGEESMIPGGDTTILAGDMLILLSSDNQELAAIKELTGRI